MDSSMEGVEEILRKMTRHLRELKEMGSDEADDMDAKTKLKVMRRTVQVAAGVEDIRDSLQHAVINRLSPRQIEMMEFDQGEKGTRQQSQQMKWPDIFSKCFKMSLNVKIFKQKLMDFTEDVDLILLSTILADLSHLDIQVEQLRDPATLKNISRLDQSQEDSNDVTNQNIPDEELSNFHRPSLNRQISKSADCLSNVQSTTDNKVGRRVKYKKNKTDSLAYALSNPIPMRAVRKTSGLMGHRPSEESLMGYHRDNQGTGSNYSLNSDKTGAGSRKQSQSNLSNVESKHSEKKRKKSIIDSVSTMFKNKL